MSSPPVGATLLFALFAFLFIGAMLAAAFVLDRRRVKDVEDSIPERIDTAADVRRRATHDEGQGQIEVHLAKDQERPRGSG